jgi:hypothetical protein
MHAYGFARALALQPQLQAVAYSQKTHHFDSFCQAPLQAKPEAINSKPVHLGASCNQIFKTGRS